jgi:chromate transport protein ChrA
VDQGPGRRRHAVAAAFILPSFVMVLGLSALYVRFGGLPWMQSAFYGIGAAVIAIIARSALKLVKMTIGKDRLLWACSAPARSRRPGPRTRSSGCSSGRACWR